MKKHLLLIDDMLMRGSLTFATAIANIDAIAIENVKPHEVLKQRLAALKDDVDGWHQFLAFS